MRGKGGNCVWFVWRCCVYRVSVSLCAAFCVPSSVCRVPCVWGGVDPLAVGGGGSGAGVRVLLVGVGLGVGGWVSVHADWGMACLGRDLVGASSSAPLHWFIFRHRLLRVSPPHTYIHSCIHSCIHTRLLQQHHVRSFTCVTGHEADHPDETQPAI